MSFGVVLVLAGLFGIVMLGQSILKVSENKPPTSDEKVFYIVGTICMLLVFISTFLYGIHLLKG